MKQIQSLCLLLCLTSSSLLMADESYGDLSARIDDLEKRMGGKGPGGEDFVTRDELESIIKQIRELRGRIEVLEHKGASLPARSADAILSSTPPSHLPGEVGPTAVVEDEEQAEDDVEAILKDLGGTSKAAKDTLKDKATEKAEKEAPTGSLERNDESAQYNQAMALYKQQEYAEAEEAFRYYVKTFPKGKQVSQARIHIAECQLAAASQSKQKDLAKTAAADFATAYKANPKGSLGAQALLGMAKSMKLQGETKKACVVLKKLKADFPNEKAIMKTTQDLSKQYKCG
ncbi:tetratricopeptide repeat protein [Candidatus Odyssella thessalonicensis]|uniref:tetratricopeptide repeat protein n=1 Tax=Candidatus Odyssella thessalonicensis TaxID=84647 RepID=UPI000225C1DE|nr:tetratricopeptide repeat protein [Candidatus Odyssella thessalonicensis]